MRSQMVRNSLVGGVIAGILSFVYFWFLYKENYPSLITKKEISIAFNVLAMLGAVWIYSKQRKSVLHLWEGLSVSYLTNLIGALVSATLIYLFITQTNNDVLMRLMAESRQLLDLNKDEIIRLQGADSYKQLLQGVSIMTAGDLFTDEIFKKMLYGIVPALLIAMYFRRVSHYS